MFKRKIIKLGVVGVDSGQLMICDPCYIKDEFLTPDSEGKSNHAHQIYKHEDGTLWQFCYKDESPYNPNKLNMQNHSQLTDQQFEKQFQNCTLAPKLFTHEAHLRLAWIHIKKYGIENALENVPTQIIQFVDNLGASHKYNHTLTVAAIKTVYHFVLKSKSASFQALLEAYPRLKFNFKDLLSCHYGFDIFNDEVAKLEYIAPDLLPFD